MPPLSAGWKQSPMPKYTDRQSWHHFVLAAENAVEVMSRQVESYAVNMSSSCRNIALVYPIVVRSMVKPLHFDVILTMVSE